MPNETIISGKAVLLVDDEPDVLETLEDILTMCELTRASSYEEAAALLERGVRMAIAAGTVTPDLGGDASTAAFANAVISAGKKS